MSVRKLLLHLGQLIGITAAAQRREDRHCSAALQAHREGIPSMKDFAEN